MSFDLYFCWQTDARLDTAGFCDFFAGVPNFTTKHLKDGNIQIWYENEGTGVYFSFESEKESTEPEERFALPAGFFDAGIAFNLNFNRPCFFAHEAMPWVETFAKALDLWIVDPQEDRDAALSVPKRYTANELTESWERHNSWAVGALHDKNKGDEALDFRYCPREKSLYWWNYTREVDGLQRRLGDSVFVPSLRFYNKRKESAVFTAFLWSDALPQVFPEADLVIHNRVGRNWRGQLVSKELQVLPFGEVVASLEQLLKPCESHIPGLRYLHPENSKETRRIFRECKGASFKEYNDVATDNFVDVVLNR